MTEDIIGKTIGHLTVVERLSVDEWHRMQYRCKCDCGGEIVLNRAQLRRGEPYHCGCRKQLMRSDLAGKTFGRLTVIGPSDKRGPRGKRTVPLWECRCECGEICYKATDTLTNPDESMCAKCADKVHTTKARKEAGFVEKTQISKLKSEKMSKANTSGVKGVSYHARDNLWRAQIGFKGQKISLGYYRNFEDAVKARRRAEEKYFDTFLEAYCTDSKGLDVPNS